MMTVIKGGCGRPLLFYYGEFLRTFSDSPWGVSARSESKYTPGTVGDIDPRLRRYRAHPGFSPAYAVTRRQHPRSHRYPPLPGLRVVGRDGEGRGIDVRRFGRSAGRDRKDRENSGD